MLKEYIQNINDRNEKALSVFLTAGFPQKENFVDLAVNVFNAGADMIELGFPFSDPQADGPIIQYSSNEALKNGVDIPTVFKYAEKIKSKVNKSIIMMGYANPVLRFGVDRFIKEANNSGVDGLIIPDIPVDEYDNFYGLNSEFMDIILLTTPQTSENRIKMIDEKSKGFVYCVSVSGTTGERTSFSNEAISSLIKTKSIIEKNKMLIGFGISNPEVIKQIKNVADGFIVGSAVIKRLIESKNNYQNVYSFVSSLKDACR